MEYLGSASVRYDFKGRIESIGGVNLYYDSYSGKVERIADALLTYDSYSGRLESADGIRFYYEYDALYGYRIQAIGECRFYYDGDYLSKITYYTLPCSYSKEWYAQACREGTVTVCYVYLDRIRSIGNTTIF